MHTDQGKPLLEGLFPPGIESGAAWIRPGLAPRFPIEADAIAHAVASRRAEFLSGRELARALLSDIECPAKPIPVGHRRMAIWPDGFVGSIAHAGAVCVCAVARLSSFAAVGIDLEPDEPLEDSLEATICTPDELRAVQTFLRTSSANPVRLVFSAKESVFKALFPITGAELEFQQVQICWDEHRTSFTASISGVPENIAEIANRLRGAFRMTRGWIVTGAWLEGRG